MRTECEGVRRSSTVSPGWWLAAPWLGLRDAVPAPCACVSARLCLYPRVSSRGHCMKPIPPLQHLPIICTHFFSSGVSSFSPLLQAEPWDFHRGGDTEEGSVLRGAERPQLPVTQGKPSQDRVQS